MKSLPARVKPLLPHQREGVSPCSEIIHTTTLLDLLPEILLSIFDFLSSVDFLCFSLCSHRLRELSLKQISRLPPCMGGHKLFLTRLERDLPEYFACDYCEILHRYDGSESFELAGLPSGEACQLPCARPWWFTTWATMRSHSFRPYSPNQLSFLQLKLAMRRFYCGPRAGVSTDSLFYTQIRRYPLQSTSTYPDRIALFSREAQICPDPVGLYVRMQDIVLVNTLADLSFDPGSKVPALGSANPIEFWEICVHHSFLRFIQPIVESISTEEMVSFAYTCRKCNTDSVIETGGFDSKIAVIMTRWVNLGPGLTRRDLLWTTHVSYIFRRARLDKEDPDRLFTAHSPRLRFENVSRQSFEELRSYNLSFLRDHRYKQDMPFSPELNLWHISYKEPSKGWGIGFPWAWLRRSTWPRKNGTVVTRP